MVSVARVSSRPGIPPVVIGVDIGTTSTKVIAFDATGAAQAAHRVSYSLDEPHPGYAEQDPEVIVAAVLQATRETVVRCNAPIAGLSFSSAMHSLIAIDAAGAPLTPSMTWADVRATDQAERLRADSGAAELHRRTGTPLQPMSPLLKLLWIRENHPELLATTAHWIGIKDYVLQRLCGQLLCDHSMASATGLLDISLLTWDTEALELAGLSPDRLPPLVPSRHVLAGLDPTVARHLAVPPATPVVIGAGDGPLANLGVGAVRAGVAACSIGTSGAVRVVVDEPTVDVSGETFCYALCEGRWVTGQAISNGGVVLDWAAESLAPDLAGPGDVLEVAAQAPPGSDRLIMLPQLLGERAPHWTPWSRAAVVGVTRDHGRPHLLRAAVEGVCFQVAAVVRSLRDAGHRIDEVRATGGFARSRLWRQILSDVLDMPVGYGDTEQGSCLGAALLGMDALGIVDSIDDAAALVAITENTRPDPSAVSIYRSLRPVFDELSAALVPAFRSLRAAAPTPPHPGRG